MTGSLGDAPAESSAAESGVSETVELARLFNALPGALGLASKLLRERSTNAPEYIAADAEVARIITRINAIVNG